MQCSASFDRAVEHYCRSTPDKYIRLETAHRGLRLKAKLRQEEARSFGSSDAGELHVMTVVEDHKAKLAQKGSAKRQISLRTQNNPGTGSIEIGRRGSDPQSGAPLSRSILSRQRRRANLCALWKKQTTSSSLA
jgi:hypothetical protein